MKSIARHILLFVCLIQMPWLAFSQATIKMHFSDIDADTIFIKGMNAENTMESIAALPFQADLTFKSKNSLAPGIYWIMTDSNFVDVFLISSAKGQTFEAQISPEESIYTNSPENAKYHQYGKDLQQFDIQLGDLNQEYQKAQRSMPQYMLRVLADTLTVKAERINANKRNFQMQTIRENSGTLMASVIATSLEIPQPPKSYLNNRKMMQQYYCQHFFDGFPWKDARIYHTPIFSNKLKDFTQFFAQCNRPDLDQYVFAFIDSSKIDTACYFAFFDALEKQIGDHASPLRIERIYIPMLKDMLSYPKLSAIRERHCRYELNVIDKNNVGSIVPDFRMVLNTGDTTSLYQIQSEYMLLYLQHPTCPTCQRVRAQIAEYPILNRAIASGRLKVLTIYFEDENEIWNNYIHSSEANPSYMHGWNFDQSIQDKKLYDTRAIPYMFLLDKDKKVIVKNVNEIKLEDEIKLLNILN